MKMGKYCILIIFSFLTVLCSGQLQKVVVEKYYVSDASDATDTTGGILESGSTTWRIYLDLAPGSTLKSIFGDTEHPFVIHSTQNFYNHKADGQTFAKDFLRARFQESTIALDTWLTLAQVARKQGAYAQYGILKPQDTNGSFVGGANNDGGSALIAGGLLINADPSCGEPLTEKDGIDTSSIAPQNWQSNGILNFALGTDSTIFGSIVPGNHFESQAFSLSCSGASGIVPDSNQVVVAQLTTKGDLSFTINAEVEWMENGILRNVRYVGTNVAIGDGFEYNPFLSYPYSCGCTDPNYLEYDPAAICLTEGSCNTLRVLGCMDTMACNYDPRVNTHFDALCCYPGWCAGRNIEEVCPQLKGNSFDISIYPNPVEDLLYLQVINGVSSQIECKVYSVYGVLQKQFKVENAPLNYSTSIDTSELESGIYQVRVTTSSGTKSLLFVRK
jgi:hypothetical protein